MTHIDTYFQFQKGNSPIVATAIHNGHRVRREIADHLALSADARLREEDPFTGDWTGITDNHIIVYQSRFETDLNRPRDRAVYQHPEDAWGLQVWRHPLSPAHIECSLAQYDAFYKELYAYLSDIQNRLGRFVVLDLHTYNHRRDGADTPSADPAANPEVNIGTGTIDRTLWAPLVDGFISHLRAFDFQGRHLDVRENVKFSGGYFPQWIHEHFPKTGCAIAVEFKKFFMDEWTGTLYPAPHAAIRAALETAASGILDMLRA